MVSPSFPQFLPGYNWWKCWSRSSLPTPFLPLLQNRWLRIKTNVHRLFSHWIAWETSSVYSQCRDSHVDPWFLGSTTWYFLVLHSNLNGLKSFAVRYLYSYLPKKCRRGAVSRRYRTMAKYFVAYVHAIFWDPFLCIVRPSPKGGENVRWYAHAKGSDSQNLAFRSNIWFIGKTNS